MTEQERITAIRDRCDKATWGPWYVRNYGDKKYVSDETRRCFATLRYGGMADADFIAHSREDIPFLLSLLDKAMEDMVHDCPTCGKANCEQRDKWWNDDRCSCSDWEWRGAK